MWIGCEFALIVVLFILLVIVDATSIP
ncbi:YjcZ family sporulation protein [Bacillus clarus]|uniref:YjcZ family sporulation protein n=1 Tax=Bacillus clarus TaxID=2338372 RepID=A0ABX9KLI7_9BACI|nr:YjcZ family sporulation protein [Bacillus clarus]